MFLRSECRALPLFADWFLLQLFCLKMGVQWEGRPQTTSARFMKDCQCLKNTNPQH